MGFYIFVFSILGVIFALYALVVFIEKRQSKNKRRSLILKNMTYISGLKDIRPNQHIHFKVKHTEIEIHDAKTEKTTIITYDNLIEVSSKTESEIKSNVTLPRILMLGALAFFAEKKTHENKHFLIIKFVDSGEEHHVLLFDEYSNGGLDSVVTTIRQAKWDYENKGGEVVR